MGRQEPGSPQALLPLALAGRGSGAPSLAVPARRSPGCGSRRGPALPLPGTAAVAAPAQAQRERWRSRAGPERGGIRRGGAAAKPGWGEHGAALGCAGSLRRQQRQHPLSLDFPQASFSLPSVLFSLLPPSGLPGSSHGGALSSPSQPRPRVRPLSAPR